MLAILSPTLLGVSLGMEYHRAFGMAGSNHIPCDNCCCNAAHMCYYMDAIKKLQKHVTKLMRKGFKCNQIHHHLYCQFVNDEYTYLLELLQLEKLPQMHLPFCIEKGIKNSFPSLPNVPYTGFIPRTSAN